MTIQKSKIKNQNYNSKIKSFTFYFLLVLLTLNFYLLIFNTSITTYAQTTTPSANIKEKLDELKKEIASKAAKIKQEVNQQLQNKAYVGVIKTKSDSSLTVAAKSGSKIINVNQDTIYQGTTASQATVKKTSIKKVTVNFSLLKEEDSIVALGDIDESGVLTAKKIILLPVTSNPTPKTHLWGEIVSISDRSVTLKNKNGENKSVSISADAKFKKGNEDTTLTDLKKDSYVIVSGYLNDNQTLSADYVYIIPEGAEIKLTPETSQSATPSASAKATAKPTPKPTATP